MEGEIPFAISRAWGCEQGMIDKVQQQMEIHNMMGGMKSNMEATISLGSIPGLRGIASSIHSCEQPVRRT